MFSGNRQQDKIGLCGCGSNIIIASSYRTKNSIIHFQRCKGCNTECGKEIPLNWRNIGKPQVIKPTKQNNHFWGIPKF